MPNHFLIYLSYGPNSEELRIKLREIDDTIGWLMERLEYEGYTNKINVLIVGDHGMAETDSERTITLGEFINFEDIQWSYTRAVALLSPKPGKRDEVHKIGCWCFCYFLGQGLLEGTTLCNP